MKYKHLFQRQYFHLGLSDDITNELNTDFINAYEAFRKIVVDSDERIAKILYRLLRPCQMEIKTMNIEIIYRVC